MVNAYCNIERLLEGFQGREGSVDEDPFADE